jgi:hypothetical protein
MISPLIYIHSYKVDRWMDGFIGGFQGSREKIEPLILKINERFTYSRTYMCHDEVIINILLPELHRKETCLQLVSQITVQPRL